MRANRPMQHNEVILAGTRPYRTGIISCNAQLAHISRAVEAMGRAYQANPNFAFRVKHRGGECAGFCGLRTAWRVGFVRLRINVLWLPYLHIIAALA